MLLHPLGLDRPLPPWLLNTTVPLDTVLGPPSFLSHKHSPDDLILSLTFTAHLYANGSQIYFSSLYVSLDPEAHRPTVYLTTPSGCLVNISSLTGPTLNPSPPPASQLPLFSVSGNFKPKTFVSSLTVPFLTPHRQSISNSSVPGSSKYVKSLTTYHFHCRHRGSSHHHLGPQLVQ